MNLLSFFVKHAASLSERIYVLAIALLVMGSIAAPRAEWVHTTFSNVNPGEVVTINSSTFGTESGWAGVYNFTNTTSDIGLSGNLKTFCIDIGQDIYSGTTTTFDVRNLANAPTPGTQMGQYRANLIGELWYQNYANIGTSNSNAAAFQIAIWEIINETTTDSNGKLVLSVTDPTGSFYVTNTSADTLNTANSWLQGLNLNGTGPLTPGLIAMTSDTYQDYVVQGPVATPAPSGLVLGMTGAFAFLLPMAWRSRKWFSVSYVPVKSGRR